MKGRDPSLQQLEEKSRQELIAYALQTQERLVQAEQQLHQTQQELAVALAQIQELKRQLFGAKADRLTPEQEEQLAQVMGDLEEQARREPPASQDVLIDPDGPAEEPGGKKRRSRRRHPTPEHLEVQEVILEPEGRCECPHCRQFPPWMKDLITQELDFVPARFILRRYIRRQYGACQCGHFGIQVAPMPPRLLPQSKLGVGLAVHILLARFDDHVAYYTLERIFIGQFRQLYRIEDAARELELASGPRHALRQQKDAASIWASMKTRAEELKPGLLPESSMGKAVRYFLNEYEALIGYLEDGRREIDNNLIENSVRPTCVGKKRWLFIGHPDAGWRSAVIYTLIITCRRLAINPQEYLTSVLTNLHSITTLNVDDWLPSRWKQRQAKTDTS